MSERRMLLVHAHPDDETLATGGVIARYAAEGVDVALVTCTLGEQGEIILPELAGLGAEHADQLGGYRLGELCAACSALGVCEQRFLGGVGRWRDSGMVVEPGGRAGLPADLHPRAFAGGPLAEQVAQLVDMLDELRPQVVVTYGPDGGYGHPDHVRAHQVTMAAVAQVPAVARVFWVVRPRSAVDAGIAAMRGMAGLPFTAPDPGGLPAVADEEVSTVLDVGAQVQTIMRAIRAHRTQVRLWEGSGGHRAFALSDGVARPVPGCEYFTLASGTAPDAEGDLFAGLTLP
ncbi:MAG: N-acetyl-1-D-myo-inositol-2-amino-2-deoxy-alpha-D-glucopyranoside deacetylase [Actinomycetota bacterium]|nr:N-acetyl-1-D-myo-inositol-2-amino-2-deoxy-alpha-D-glucopyranoside deacetylase [Actinomycetota bacterium]